MASFNFYLCLFSIISYILQLFLFAGHIDESVVIRVVNGPLQDEMLQEPPEQMSVEQATLEQMTWTADELMHDAFGTSSEEEEEGHEEEGWGGWGSASQL
jgi:hypothetical protein